MSAKFVMLANPHNNKPVLVNSDHVRTASESAPNVVTLVMDGGLHQNVDGGYDASDRRRRSPEPKLVGSASRIARGRNLQDAGHCANGIQGLMRAHEPVNPFGLALLSRANQAAAFARMSRS